MRGIVIKGIGGFYFVYSEGTVFRARGRGLLKKDKDLIFVGDNVEAYPPVPGDDDGIIEKVYDRKNYFLRPPVANIDKMIVMLSVKSPQPNLEVVDRLLVMSESKGIEPIVCINKADLDEKAARDLEKIYKDLYPTVVTSYLTGYDSIAELIDGLNVALAGPSGVGKSTLTNALIPDAEMETGDVSRKTDRGRHTTRHVEMFPINNGFLFDTPGFTSFDLSDITEEELGRCFPDIHKSSERCRFGNCTHTAEPDCGVLEDLNNGLISKSRYQSFISSVEEIKKGKKYG